jgi:hypothetical protein
LLIFPHLDFRELATWEELREPEMIGGDIRISDILEPLAVWITKSILRYRYTQLFATGGSKLPKSSSETTKDGGDPQPPDSVISMEDGIKDYQRHGEHITANLFWNIPNHSQKQNAAFRRTEAGFPTSGHGFNGPVMRVPASTTPSFPQSTSATSVSTISKTLDRLSPYSDSSQISSSTPSTWHFPPLAFDDMLTALSPCFTMSTATTNDPPSHPILSVDAIADPEHPQLPFFIDLQQEGEILFGSSVEGSCCGHGGGGNYGSGEGITFREQMPSRQH